MRRRRLLASLSLGVLLGLVIAIASFASPGPVGTASGFEDDDGNLAVDSTFDWNGFAPAAWAGTPPYRESDGFTSGWTFKGIEDAQVTTSDTAFAGGTKQDDDCATVKTGKAPNKDDLKRIYLSTKVVDGSTYLNLAWVRIPQNTTSSSAHVAFEFNKGTNGPCGGSSDDLVERVDGDMLVVYDFEGGSTEPTIKLARWTTTAGDSCDVASHDPPCWGTAINLTALGFAEAEVNTGDVDDALAPPQPPPNAGASVTETLEDSEFGEAGIDLTGAGVFDPGTCESFGTAFGVSRSSGNSGTAQMKDLVGPADFTIANCGTVIIHKVTDPPGDTTTSFGYTTDVTTTPSTTTSPFSLMDGETNTIVNVNPGSGLNVTEDDPGPNYKLTDIDCSESTVPAGNRSTDLVGRAVTFSLAAGETLECTFTNDLQEGALQILKRSTKGEEGSHPLVSNDGAVFSYDGSSVTDGGSGDEDPTTGKVCVSGLAPGDYTVSEDSPPSGYGPAPMSEQDQSVTVVDGTNCTDNPPGSSGTATFHNPPLADIQVNFRDGGSGETSADIECEPSGGSPLTPDSTTPPDGWDTSAEFDDLTPDTYDCTVLIDP